MAQGLDETNTSIAKDSLEVTSLFMVTTPSSDSPFVNDSMRIHTPCHEKRLDDAAPNRAEINPFLSSKQRHGMTPFPEKLMVMLEESERRTTPQYSGAKRKLDQTTSSSTTTTSSTEAALRCVSWTPSGKAFIIWNKDVFVRDVLPRFFGSKHMSFTSFRRMLLRWGFRQEDAATALAQSKTVAKLSRSKGTTRTSMEVSSSNTSHHHHHHHRKKTQSIAAAPVSLSATVAAPRKASNNIVGKANMSLPELRKKAPWLRCSTNSKKQSAKLFRHELFQRDNKSLLSKMSLMRGGCNDHNCHVQRQSLRNNLIAMAQIEQAKLTSLSSARRSSFTESYSSPLQKALLLSLNNSAPASGGPASSDDEAPVIGLGVELQRSVTESQRTAVTSAFATTQAHSSSTTKAATSMQKNIMGLLRQHQQSP